MYATAGLALAKRTQAGPLAVGVRGAQARRFLSHLADATGVPYNDRAFCAVAAFQSPGCMLASDGTRLKSHG